MPALPRLALILAAALAWPGASSAGPTPAAQAQPGPALTQGLRLLMVDMAGCPFCAQWKREVLPGYGDHAEGRAAPLAVVAIDGPWPDGLVLASRPRVTPSFILLDHGREMARIEGYDGPASFWPALRAALARTTPEGRP